MACILACGPRVDPAPSDGTGSASSAGSPEGSGESSSIPPGEVDSGEAGPQSSGGIEASSSSGVASSTSDDPLEVECTYPGDVCDEFLVCQCDCDSSTTCCFCDPTECTEDAHCRGSEVCSLIADSHFPERECVPPVCSFLLDHVQVDDPAQWEGVACMASLGVSGDVASLAPLSSLEYVHGELFLDATTTLVDLTGLDALAEVGALRVDGNASLTSIAQLTSLQRIGEGGSITNNPLLPAAEIHALLAGIDGGDAIMVCGNLDDIAC